jgi:hypothetical protein
MRDLRDFEEREEGAVEGVNTSGRNPEWGD